MLIVRWLFNLLSLVGATLAGVWLGEQVRPAASWQAATDGRAGLRGALVLTNVVPALLVGLLTKPRWLFGMLAGFGLSALIGDRLERPLLEQLDLR